MIYQTQDGKKYEVRGGILLRTTDATATNCIGCVATMNLRDYVLIFNPDSGNARLTAPIVSAVMTIRAGVPAFLGPEGECDFTWRGPAPCTLDRHGPYVSPGEHHCINTRCGLDGTAEHFCFCGERYD